MAKTATDVAPEGAIIKDAELKAINGIVKQLSALPWESQMRVMHYVKNRFSDANIIPFGANGTPDKE